MANDETVGPAQILVRRLAIRNERGLHARAAARFVKLLDRYDVEMTVRKGDTEVSGRSIMGLMMLAAGPGSQIEVSASGADAAAALDAIADLVFRGFDES